MVLIFQEELKKVEELKVVKKLSVKFKLSLLTLYFKLHLSKIFNALL